MLLLRNPERLMLGYWLGAMTTGIASGLVIVFAFKDTGAEHTTKHTVSPVVQLVFAALLIVAAIALAKGEGKHHERRKKRRTRSRRSGGGRWKRGTSGRPSWSGSCCRFPAPPTSPL